ncbi:hypothetical protein M4D59_09755 [Priestia endophytica]|nr:hypothetical protein [Priestia endophytica]
MGTAVVTSYGINAKKDVWLAILLGMFVGIAFFSFITFYFDNIPTYLLLDILKKYLVNT